jgi:carbon-monoxide dehydrogenase medium subunit
MKPAPFEYRCPATLDEALALAAEYAGDAKLLAGGQSLIPAMNFRLLQPALLIDLNRIPELEFLRIEDGRGLRVGAMTRQRRLEQDPLVRTHAALLAEAMPWVAHPQIRNRGTLGGSLAHADPAAELPVILLALGGRALARRAGGQRWIAAGDFFRGMFATALEPGEILTEVSFPALPPHTGWSFQEASRRRGDYAMAGVAVTLTLDDSGACSEARLVFLNAGDGPVAADRAADSLRGNPVDEAAIEAAARLVEADLDPLGTLHAPPAFQKHLAAALTRRALATARARALHPS